MLVFPILYTERLILRKLEVDDFNSLVKYANNKKIADQIINIPYPYREPDAAFRMSHVVQGFKNKSRFVFAITFKETKELIGEISLNLNNGKNNAELGYWVGEPFWNKGIATESIRAILKFGFEKLNMASIFATTHFENKASEKVLRNNGMSEDSRNGRVIQFSLSETKYSELNKETNQL